MYIKQRKRLRSRILFYGLGEELMIPNPPKNNLIPLGSFIIFFPAKIKCYPDTPLWGTPQYPSRKIS